MELPSRVLALTRSSFLTFTSLLPLPLPGQRSLHHHSQFLLHRARLVAPARADLFLLLLLLPSALLSNRYPVLPELPDASIRVAIDRGGTFTDVWASFPDVTGASEATGGRKEIVVKLRTSLHRPPASCCLADLLFVQSPSIHQTTETLPSRVSVESSRLRPDDPILAARSSTSPRSSTRVYRLPSQLTVCSNGRERRLLS